MARNRLADVPADVRFWAKVQQDGDCWVWVGAKTTTNGYGLFRVGNGKNMVAHRWAYRQIVGEIPEGLDLDHLCRNRACVNPYHLDPVTRRVNLLRGQTLPAMEARRTACGRGHEYRDGSWTLEQGKRRCLDCRRIKDSKRPSGWTRARASKGAAA